MDSDKKCGDYSLYPGVPAVYDDDSSRAGKLGSLIATEKGWIFCSSLFTIAALWDLL
jgi:hypothetical protein